MNIFSMIDIINIISLFLNNTFKRILAMTSKNIWDCIISKPLLSIKEVFKYMPKDSLCKKEVVCWSIKNKFNPFSICNIAAEFGYKDIIIYMRTFNYPWNEKTFSNAAKNNQLTILKYLHDNECPWDEYTFNNAVMGDRMNILKWLYNNKCPWSEKTFSNASMGTDIKKLKWLYNNKCPWNENTFNNAARLGDLNILKWLLENKCPWSVNTFANAATTGNLDLLKWLYENECPWDKNTFINVAKTGNLTALKWLYENRCPSSRQTLNIITNNTSVNLEMVIWLYNNTMLYQNTEHIYNNSIEYNHVELFKLLFKEYNIREDPFDEDMDYIVSHSCIEIIEHALIIRKGKYKGENSIYFSAVYRGNIKILELLKKYNCYWYPEVFRCAVTLGNLKVLTWLHENKCLWCYGYGNIYCDAAKTGRLDVMIWLYNNGYLLYKEDILKEANINKCIADVENTVNVDIIDSNSMEFLNSQKCIELSNNILHAYIRNDIYSTAIEFGHFNIIEWLYEKKYIGYSIDKYHSIAIKYNRLEILDWLYKNKIIPLNIVTDNSLIEQLEYMDQLYVKQRDIIVDYWLSKRR